MRYFQVNKRLLKLLYFIPLILLIVLVAFLGQQVQNPKPLTLPTSELAEVTPVNENEPIQPIPLDIKLDEKKVELGEKLFTDPHLSANKKGACVSCHGFDTGGVDRLARSLMSNEKFTAVNTPTVFNSAFNFRLNWDGKDENLWDNVETSLRGLSVTWDDVLPILRNSPAYVSAFERTYPDGITKENVSDAIATFETSLYTPNSRFDQFLRGNTKALTETETEGYNIFKAYGCVSCHQGVNVGGNMYQKFGVMGNYFADRGNITKSDFGRFNLTGEEKDRYVFRVPSLRNIELTPPYFHDGSTKTLKEAIAIMGKYQLGRSLSDKQIDLIVEFLQTLTGEYRGKSLSSQSNYN